MERTYQNPVYDRNFPDPFVLRFNGRYYAYGTGFAEDGRCFPMLTSTDLVQWEPHGGALERLDLPGAEEYWAPEVAYRDGRFYMYYATGREVNPDHHLRLATAEHPLGPWQDAGINLTPHEIFAIDAHPFRDPRDGQWYLYYARDELEPPYAGTGAVVDRLLAMDRLEGEPRRVLRPYAPWQVFELKRAIKNNLDWYTIEGPFVLRAGGKYVCFYSGGRYENPNYGVAYVVADHPLGPWVDEANAEGPQVLTTVPGHVLGPGHNSVADGPDLVSQWIVYHGWDASVTARYMRIDPLYWDGATPRCPGPSYEPRPAPRLPELYARFDEAEPGPEWERRSGWERREDGLCAFSPAILGLRRPLGDFAAELSVRFPHAASRLAVTLGEAAVAVSPAMLQIGPARAAIPPGTRMDAWHRLLVTRREGRLTAVLDEYPSVTVDAPEGQLGLALTGSGEVTLAHFVLSALS